MERLVLRRPAIGIALFAFGTNLLATLSLGASLPPGIDRMDSLGQYVHTRWALRDGFSLFPIQTLAQTEDGYLWLGTPSGLWRFDGIRFTQWQPGVDHSTLPSDDIRCLYPARGGGLWIGTASGIRRLDHGKLTRLPAEDAVFNGIRALFDDPATGLWAGMNGYENGGLAHFDGAKVSLYGVKDGLPDSGVDAIFRDRNGQLWVGTRLGLVPWPPLEGAPHSQSTGPEVYSISESSQGELLTASTTRSGGVQKLIRGNLIPLAGLPESLTARAMLGDRDGNIWLGTFSQGLARWRDGVLEWFTKEDGLSGTAIQALLEDREGNIWVGTRSGLDRFRPAIVRHLSVSEGLSEDVITVVHATRDGSIWVGTPRTGLNRIDAQSAVHKQQIKGMAGSSILSLYEDSSSRLLVGTLSGLAVVEPGREGAEEISGGDDKFDRVTAIAGDSGGAIWFADGRKGIYKIINGRAERVAATNLPLQTDVYALIADAQGNLWIGYHHGRVAVVHGTSTTIYDPHSGIAPGPILALYQDAAGSIWLGAGGGLSRFRNNSWTTWTTASGLPSAPVHDIIADDHGGLWLITPSGLVRLDQAELARQRDGSPGPLSFSQYGISAGMRPQVNAVWAKPRSAKPADGRLWFATEEGLAIVDFARTKFQTSPAGIVIEQVDVDGRSRDVAGEASDSISIQGKDIRFDYTATGLTSPESIRFRYRLDGFDRDWIRADTRRQAFYTNVPPGTYRFQVVASNLEGTWSETGTVLQVNMLPAFHQTFLFRSVAVLAGLGLMFGLYRLRVAQVVSQMEAGAAERLAERTRIARDLHDTLLQAVVGVSLQIEVFANQLRAASEADRAALHRIRTQLEDALRQTRYSVWTLRAISSRDRDLGSALRQLGAALTSGSSFEVVTTTEGETRTCARDVEEQLLRISQSAIANAVEHSKGTRITIRLSYLPKTIELRVEDDGCGIDAEIVEQGRPGHFGLQGMRERAERIGADISIDSQPGAGTIVKVTIRTSKYSRFAIASILQGLLWNRASSQRGSSHWQVTAMDTGFPELFAT